MYEISITTHFSAAHRLVGYNGACADLHGHNWEVDVFIRGDSLDELGMLVDFREVKRAVGSALAELDHKDLNEVSIFANKNPTSENIAAYLFDKLSGAFDSDRCEVQRITVHETPQTGASYCK